MEDSLQIQDWQHQLIKQLSCAVAADEYWKQKFNSAAECNAKNFGIHLAVFREPFLKFVLDGSKTIESRFSRKLCPPFNCVYKGDVVLLKRVGGGVVGICQVAHPWYYQLDAASWHEIQSRYTAALCAQDPDFWLERSEASFATLLRVEHVLSIASIPCRKRDRRGWVVLRSKSVQLELKETQL